MSFQKDTIWEVVKGAETIESFKEKIVCPIFVNKNIRQDVREDLAIIEKILLHSYFEYEFIDVALIQAIFTLEKALKWKYQQVNNGSSCDLGFKDLIAWFIPKGYFEVWNSETINQLRSIRNNKVHNERRSLGGLTYLEKVYCTIDLINDLYEDVDLRKKRKKSINLLQKQMNTFLKEGAVVTGIGKRFIIFKADIIFLNNKLSPPVFEIAIWPIFDPQIRNNNGHLVPASKLLNLIKCDLTKGYFQGKDASSGSLITISKLEDERDIARFNHWKEGLTDPKDVAVMFPYIVLQQNNYFSSAIRKFHQS